MDRNVVPTQGKQYNFLSYDSIESYQFEELFLVCFVKCFEILEKKSYVRTQP